MLHSSMLSGLAALALLAGACGGHDHSAHGQSSHGAISAPLPGAREIPVEARSFSFSPSEIQVAPGESVNFALTSVDVLHDLTVVGLDAHVVAETGKTAVGGLSVPAQAGRYALVCTVSGHREAGMTGVLVVEPDG